MTLDQGQLHFVRNLEVGMNCGCGSKGLQGTRALGANATTPMFVPYFDLETARVGSVKPSLQLLGPSSHFDAQAGVRYSNDGETWTSVTVFGPLVEQTGSNPTDFKWGDTWVTPNGAYRFAQYGVKATLHSGGPSGAFGQVTLILDVKEP